MMFRAATPTDAAALAAFAEESFRATFAKDNTPSDMDAYCCGAFGVDKQRAELEDPTAQIIVVEDGGAVAGYVHLEYGPPPECVTGPSPVEIVRFYVDGRHHGKGLAHELMAQTLAAAKARGAQTVYLGVWERNRRAIAFYEKHGFRTCGEREFMLGADRQRDAWMVKP